VELDSFSLAKQFVHGGAYHDEGDGPPLLLLHGKRI